MHGTHDRAELERLRAENAELRRELVAQWEFNHSERCGKVGPDPSRPWVHEGRCHWPLPEVLSLEGGST